MGDGSRFKGFIVTYVYNTAGSYTVTLTVIDNKGAKATNKITVTVQTVEDAIESIISEIGDLPLNRGNANSMISKLENALRSLDNENDNATLGKLNAFINQVNAFISSGKISEDVGSALIANINAIINQITGSGSMAKRGITENADILPTNYLLEQNYPNPFNPVTTIQLQIPQSSFVTLKIYNINGTLVRTLVSERINAGFYSNIWNGTNNDGQQVSSGMYIYQLQAGKFSAAKRMLFIK